MITRTARITVETFIKYPDALREGRTRRRVVVIDITPEDAARQIVEAVEQIVGAKDCIK